jgi:hypothetical protein
LIARSSALYGSDRSRISKGLNMPNSKAKKRGERGEPKPRSGTLAMSIPQFCDRHGISEAFYFVLRQRGEGPDTMQVGARTLISVESAAQWRVKHTTPTTDEMGLKLPPTRVDIAAIRRKYHAAEREEKGQTKGAKANVKGHAKVHQTHDMAAAAKR